MKKSFLSFSSSRLRRGALPVCLSACFFVVFTSGLFALDLDLSPNKDGQLEPRLGFDWDYASDWTGDVYFRSTNATNYTDDPTGQALPQGITSLAQAMTFGVDPVYWSTRFEGGAVRFGLGTQVEYEDAQETGYMDYAWDTNGNGLVDDTVYRIFFHTRNVYTALRPQVLLRLELGNPEKVWFYLDGGYAPWMGLWVDSELSSACATAPALDTPLTKASFSSSTWHAWTAGFKFKATIEKAFSVTVDAKLDGGLYDNTILILGGGTSNDQIYKLEGTANLLVSVPALNLGGLTPQLGVGLDLSVLQNINDPADLIQSYTPRFRFGFASLPGKPATPSDTATSATTARPAADTTTSGANK